MAEERVIKIVGDTTDADKKVNKLTDDVEKLGTAAKETNETTSKGVEKVGKSAEKTNKKVGVLKGGFNKLGTAIKATGIGLFIGLVASLGAAFSKNQKFIDGFNTVTETLSIVLSKIADAVVSVYENVAKSSENFDALGRVVKGLINLAFTPLKLTFFGIKLAIKESQLAWENSFFGGKDKEKSKQLLLDITDTKNAIKQIGEEAVKSGVDVVVSFGEAIEETANIGKTAVEELGKISVKEANEQAKRLVNLRKEALLAQATQSKLVEFYDISSEKQRKIRDNQFATIEDRKKASDQLKKELENQEKAMRKVADAQIASAQAQFDKTGLVEDEVALIEAKANKLGVLAQIEGFTTEQKEQNNALLKEEIELNNSIADTEKERRLKQLEFDESQEQNELAKLDKQKERLDLENEIILQDLERKRELFKEGTQARTDAENEYALRKQEIDNSITENERLTGEQRVKNAQIESDAKRGIQNATLDTVSNGISLLKNLFEKNKGLQKASIIGESAIGIAKIVNNTQAANAAARLKYALLPGGAALATAEVGINKINAGIGIGANLAATAKALSAIGSGGGGGSAPSQDTGASAPSFNLIEGTGSNQVAQSVQNNNQQPIQAYVVGSNVTNQQDLDRQRIANSSI